MEWTPLLEREMRFAYGATRALLDQVRAEDLTWRPERPAGAESTGWMSMGELLHHLGESCGQVMEWFVRGTWPSMEPNAEGLTDMPAAASVAAARAALETDRAKASAAIAEAGEARMQSEPVTAPWGVEGTLGEQLLDCVKHLGQHKGQLFYYLKLLGRPVHTAHLWGLA